MQSQRARLVFQRAVLPGEVEQHVPIGRIGRVDEVEHRVRELAFGEFGQQRADREDVRRRLAATRWLAWKALKVASRTRPTAWQMRASSA